MKQHYFAFMKNLFEKGHAEPVPSQDLTLSKPCGTCHSSEYTIHRAIHQMRRAVNY